jgi:hypothetical protein
VKAVGLIKILTNEQTLSEVMRKMPVANQKQWAQQRPTWMQGKVSREGLNILDQNWRDSLEIPAADLYGTVMGVRLMQPRKQRSCLVREPRRVQMLSWLSQKELRSQENTQGDLKEDGYKPEDKDKKEDSR